jgi:hypothetical protein
VGFWDLFKILKKIVDAMKENAPQMFVGFKVGLESSAGCLAPKFALGFKCMFYFLLFFFGHVYFLF